MNQIKTYAIKRLGPRVVGGTYWCGYWRRSYVVDAIVWTGDDWMIHATWEDGRHSRHCTAWDYRRDQVIDQESNRSNQMISSNQGGNNQ